MTYPTKKLGEVCDFKVMENHELLPYVGMEDIESGTGCFLGSKEPRTVKSVSAHFDQNCVLYGKLRPYLNKVFLPDFEGHSSTELIPLRPNGKLLTREWLMHWLMSPSVVVEMSKNIAGSRMPRANLDHLKNLQIPLPPIEEQGKIVAKLERVLGKIKEAKELREESEKSTDSLLAAELHKIFEKGKKNGWVEKELGENVELQGGFAFKSSEYKSGGLPLVRIKNLQNEEVNFKNAVHVDKAKQIDLQNFLLNENDILIAMSGATTGKMARVSKDKLPAFLNQRVGRFIIRDKTKVDNSFLWYFLKSLQDFILRVAYGGAQPNVSPSRIEAIKIPTPSLTEQKKIVARLDTLSEKIKKLQEYQKQTRIDLVSLEQSILHQAFNI